MPLGSGDLGGISDGVPAVSECVSAKVANRTVLIS